MSNFSETLKALRKEFSLTQQELANHVGVSKSSINMYERGEREPSIDKLTDIAKFFDVGVEYLIGLSPFKNIEKEIEKCGGREQLEKDMKELHTIFGADPKIFRDRFKECLSKSSFSLGQISEATTIKIDTLTDIIEGRKFKLPAPIQISALADVMNTTYAHLAGLDLKHRPTSSFYVNNEEQELLKKYRAIDARGRDMVDTVLDKEYERVQEQEELVEIPLVARSGDNEILKVTKKDAEEGLRELDEAVKRSGHESDHL